MPGIDFEAAARLARTTRQLARRADGDLPFVTDADLGGPGLLLDTTIYVDRLRDRLGPQVEQLIRSRPSHHATGAIAELMHTVGVLDPRHPGTPVAVDAIRQLIESMPAHRIRVPDTDTIGRGAVLAGVLCRLQGYRQDRRRKALQDSILFLQGLKDGLTVVTRNIADFDYLIQLLPRGRVLMYR